MANLASLSQDLLHGEIVYCNHENITIKDVSCRKAKAVKSKDRGNNKPNENSINSHSRRISKISSIKYASIPNRLVMFSRSVNQETRIH